jgi:hypothetical protein
MQDLRDASQTPLSSAMLLWYNNNTRHVAATPQKYGGCHSSINAVATAASLAK